MRLCILVAGGLGVAGVLSGCNVLGLACSEVGCRGGLIVDLRATELIPGDYTVEFELDDGEALETCGFTVSDDCDGGGTCIPTTDCDGRVEVLALGDGQLQVSLFDAEGAVDLVLERDGTVLLDETLDPEYETFRPNGPSCPPVCRSATVQLSLD